MFKFLCVGVLLAGALTRPAFSRAEVLDAVAILHQFPRDNMCAITFDDGPTAFTARLLDSLREEGIHATFFLLGQRIKQRPDLVRRMMEEGHEVGNHSYSHPNMHKLSPAARHYEMEQTNVLLRELGAAPRYFRPPYGKYDGALARMARDMDMDMVMWTTDSRDWKRRPADYRNLPTFSGLHMRPEEMRGVFLFHDTQQSTVQDVKRIVRDLRQGGCRSFVTVSEFFDGLPPEESPLMTARPEAPQTPEGALPPHAQPGGDAPRTYEPATPERVSPPPLARSSPLRLWPALFRSGG